MTQPEFIYCGCCKKEVRYHYDPVNHWKQLLLTLLSLGLWLPMWICVVYVPSKICDECNNPVWNDPPPKTVAVRRNAS